MADTNILDDFVAKLEEAGLPLSCVVQSADQAVTVLIGLALC